MLVSEEDAKTKWCPFARIYPGEPGMPAANRHNQHNDDDPANCIAARCMAWRIDSDGAGYCGLAGSPQVLNTYKTPDQEQ